jgi:hypothetical protein
MAVIKQGGQNPYAGQVMTTKGYMMPRPPVCTNCRERKEGLYTRDANGQLVCADCSGSFGAGVLKGICSEYDCACGGDCPDNGEPDVIVHPSAER